VFGTSASTDGIGVYGTATASSGNNYGVYGYSNSSAGTGVFGYANKTGDYTTAGVYGRSDASNGYGVAGYNSSYGTGMAAWGRLSNLIEAYDGEYPGGTIRFWVDNSGNVAADGNFVSFKTSKLDNEDHILASVQSPEVWLEDFGRASLVDGKTVVVIAPDFAGVANLSEEYHVFLTPLGDCLGLYVINMMPSAFEVRELNGGKSTIPFSYLIVAKATGSETVRLPEVTIPKPVETNREPNEGIQQPEQHLQAEKGQMDQEADKSHPSQP
jgi:hypothetical protein